VPSLHSLYIFQRKRVNVCSLQHASFLIPLFSLSLLFPEPSTFQRLRLITASTLAYIRAHFISTNSARSANTCQRDVSHLSSLLCDEQVASFEDDFLARISRTLEHRLTSRVSSTVRTSVGYFSYIASFQLTV